MDNNDLKIILSGGGTGGPVTPLLTIAQEFYRQHNNSSFVFIGTHSGPEKILVEEVAGSLPVKFTSMLSGKWRRYFSWKNFTDIFNVGGAFFQSFYILKKEKPDLVISAGAFVSVPLVWAAKFLHIPVLIHQQDMRPGLANRLMAKAANVITVTFPNSLKVYGSKAVLTGNPYFLPALPSREAVFKKYNFNPDKKLILIFGGGTGSVPINEAVKNNLTDLLEITQVVHISGAGKMIDESRPGYFNTEFLSHNDLLSVMSQSEIVVARPGLGTLTDLSALKKASILVPMPNSHQEDNAKACADAGAAIYIEQKDLNGKLVRTVTELLNLESRRQPLETNIASIIKSGAAEMIVDICYKLIK